MKLIRRMTRLYTILPYRSTIQGSKQVSILVLSPNRSTPELARPLEGYQYIYLDPGDCGIPFSREEVSKGNRALCHTPVESGGRERSHVCEDGSKLAEQNSFIFFVKGGPYLAQGTPGDILHDDIELVDT